jgi:PAS domain S-box-containing protein
MLQTEQAYPQFLSGEGAIVERIREINWAENPLGPMEGWSPSLQSALSICLNSNFPIAIYWGEQLMLLYNEAWSSIPGNKHPWALGRPAKEVWPDIWNDIEPQFAKAFSGVPGGSKDALLPMQRHGYTEECYFDFTFTPIMGPSGKVEGIFNAVLETTYQIITKRRTDFLRKLAIGLIDGVTKEALYAETLERIRENPQDMPFAMIYSLQDGRQQIEGCTEQGCPEKLMKKPWPVERLQKGQTVYIDDLEEYLTAIPQGPWPELPHDAMLLPLRGSGGKIVAFIVSGISARRVFDAEYQTLLESLASTLSGAIITTQSLEEQRKRAEELAEIDRAKTVFFSNISHEFRTPLTLMLGPIEDVLHDPQTIASNKQRMEVAFRNGLRLQKLVNTLLEFSKIEAGRTEGRFTRVSIYELTQDLASTFRSAIEKAGMELIVRGAEPARDVYVDVDMWEKIILNMVSNAFKYSREGEIRVDVADNGETVTISVSDTGIGIPADHLDRIFDRFHRVESNEGRSMEGTGIGLALVKELVRLHEGTITVTSEAGKGSTFVVSIPTGKAHLNPASIDNVPHSAKAANNAYVAEANKWVSDDEAANETGEGNATASKPTVLLADDNGDMRDYIRRLLQPAYEVVTATNGEEALVQARLLKPSLILSDIMMPKLDGFGLLRQLREEQSLRQIPLIFLSARAGDEARVAGIESGADDYLVKPFTARELLAKVDTTIRITRIRKEAQQNMESLFMQAPAAIAVLEGPELRFTLANKLFERLISRNEEQLIGHTIPEAFPEIAGQGIYEIFNNVYQTGEPFVATEFQALIKKSGMDELYTGYYSFVAQPITNNAGAVRSILVHAVEVTEQIEARKKLEDSGARLGEAMEQLQYRKALLEAHNQTSLDGILLVDAAGKILSYNQRYVEIWNMPQQITKERDDNAALNHAMTQLVHPAQFMEKVKWLYDHPQARSTDELEFLDGKVIQRQGYPVTGDDGTYYAWSWTFRDITEYKLAERALRESEAYFRTLTDAMPQIVWTANADGYVDYWNKQWYEFSGFEEGYGVESFTPLLHPDDVQPCLETWYHSVETGKPYQIEYRFKDRLNGGYRWFLGKALPVRGFCRYCSIQAKVQEAMATDTKNLAGLI